MRYVLIIALTIVASAFGRGLHAQDPLPSWNDGKTKQSIIDFVKNVTTEGSPKFVPAEDRVATFDNDGTLWCEKPLIQGLFAFYLAKKMIDKKPALKEKQPYKAIAANDMAYLKTLSEQDLIKLVVATHTGMTAGEFDKSAAAFFATAKSPSGKAIAELVYKPQVELLQYLRANGFKTFICSGGDIDFMRPVTQLYYGIPPEQVIGTKFKYVYKDSAGINDLVRMPSMLSFNDKQEKPVNIQYHIGKRPILACGNEGGAGDIYMLRFSQGNQYSSLQLIVNHDDKDRETYYQEKDNKSLDWAKKYNWTVISMKDDWKTIF
ncbi:HAD family hydrolase [Danxiaibacter flavus]|uniref:HAD family hydrolase n=1 Tax=Danxiaibacter flavus TaxID=3049108 RepID=A0ABV3ZC42_9BACT|nr:HAD family hydrolase [Chitinophagaceae bacterium DXS]